MKDNHLFPETLLLDSKQSSEGFFEDCIASKGVSFFSVQGF